MTDNNITQDEAVALVAMAIKFEAQNRGADSPVDYGDAEQLARAAIETYQAFMPDATRMEGLVMALEDAVEYDLAEQNDSNASGLDIQKVAEARLTARANILAALAKSGAEK